MTVKLPVALLGSYVLLSDIRQWGRSRVQRILAVRIGITLLGVSSAFGYWFLFVGFPRIAPDFTEGGYANTWWEWFEAALVLAIALPVIANRLIAKPSGPMPVGEHTQPLLFLHQSLIVSIILALSVAVALLSLQLLWKYWKMPTATPIIRVTSIDARRFLLPCAALILILMLSIPTIYAFCFACWVAPWS